MCWIFLARWFHLPLYCRESPRLGFLLALRPEQVTGTISNRRRVIVRLAGRGKNLFLDTSVHVSLDWVSIGSWTGWSMWLKRLEIVRGFDIRSFDADGSDRMIEVKTTNFGARTPFFVTANELRVSERNSGRYHLYRLFHFRRAPRQYQVQGALDGGFSLSATVYRATR